MNWSATGATSVTVTADHDAKPGKISGHGLTVWPTVTTTYTVTAVNAAGTSVRTITIPVTEPAPQAWLGVISTGAPAGIGRALK